MMDDIDMRAEFNEWWEVEFRYLFADNQSYDRSQVRHACELAFAHGACTASKDSVASSREHRNPEKH